MNQWDLLSADFNTHKNSSDIHPDVADNILIAWPSLLKGIEALQINCSGLRALDFGCGTGGFCKKLKSKGYDVTGCDTSEAMINIATKNLGERITFFKGGSGDVLLLNEPFDLISAIMVFPFIDDINACIMDLSRAIKEGGLLVLAVFNPDFVEKNHYPCGVFKGFDAGTGLGNGHMEWSNEACIPAFIRSKDEYEKILNAHGFHKIFEDQPPFTDDFLQKYPTNFDTTCPEFLILGYKKKEAANEGETKLGDRSDIFSRSLH